MPDSPACWPLPQAGWVLVLGRLAVRDAGGREDSSFRESRNVEACAHCGAVRLHGAHLRPGAGGKVVAVAAAAAGRDLEDVIELPRVVQILRNEQRRFDEGCNVFGKDAELGCPQWRVVLDAVLVGPPARVPGYKALVVGAPATLPWSRKNPASARQEYFVVALAAETIPATRSQTRYVARPPLEPPVRMTSLAAAMP